MRLEIDWVGVCALFTFRVSDSDSNISENIGYLL